MHKILILYEWSISGKDKYEEKMEIIKILFKSLLLKF